MFARLDEEQHGRFSASGLAEPEAAEASIEDTDILESLFARLDEKQHGRFSASGLAEPAAEAAEASIEDPDILENVFTRLDEEQRRSFSPPALKTTGFFASPPDGRIVGEKSQRGGPSTEDVDHRTGSHRDSNESSKRAYRP